MVVFFLPSSSLLFQLASGITSLDPVELVLFLFLLSCLFLSFLSPNPFKGGSSSLFFCLTGCHLNVDIALCQFVRGDNSPLRRSGGGLGVSDCRMLVVQMHSDGWGKASLSMSVCLSSPLFCPSHLWRGDGLSPASTVSFELSSQFPTFIPTFISKHVNQHLASASSPLDGLPH